MRSSPMFMNLIRLILVVTILCLPEQFATTAEKIVTNEDVIAMVKAGLTDSAVIAAIGRSPNKFDLIPAALVKLRQAGVSNAVIEAMLGSQPASPSAKPGTNVPSSVERDQPSIQSQLPSAYGYYVLDGGQLQSLQAVSVVTRMGLEVGGNLGVGTGADGLSGDPPMILRSSSPVFIVYQQSIDASSFHFSELEFVSSMRAFQFNMQGTRPEFFPNVYGGKRPDDIVEINLWRPKVSGSLRIEPIETRPGMFRLIPENKLTPGRYALWIGNALHPANIIFATNPRRQAAAFYFGVGQLSRSTVPEPTDNVQSSASNTPAVAKRQDLSSLFQTARNAITTKDWKGTQQAYKRILDVDPQNFEAHSNLAIAYLKLGDYEKSTAHNREAMNLRPDDYRPYYNMACTYAKMRETEKAIALLKQAIAKGFKDFEQIRRDADLESIRSDPWFKTLTAQQ